MLDIDAATLSDAHHLPRGWHFALLAAETPRSALRVDGFPGFGTPLPDLGLPRLLLAGRSVTVLADILIGAEVYRKSSLKDLKHKTTASGPIAIATVETRLSPEPGGVAAIVESATYVLKGASSQAAAGPTAFDAAGATFRKVVVPDETMLFQYSALGFNSHRIHLDRSYATGVEGHPDLVVNGGLVALLMTELVRGEIGVQPTAWRIKHLAPLYCGRPVTLAAFRTSDGWRVAAMDDHARLAAEMEVEVR
ncbi:MAG: MaoC family dehydratase N-terminal domain-containing protein [Pikeienuella sp.]|uniref:FAS1-like dehydratase domain-containing protein n=1 Tax=Pikeienuella sp. TaxID=2831957 RepID=UPI00391D6AE2